MVSFDDDQDTAMLKESSQFLTEARNIGNRNEDIFLTSKPVSGFMLGVAGFFLDSLIFKLWVMFEGRTLRRDLFLLQGFLE